MAILVRTLSRVWWCLETSCAAYAMHKTALDNQDDIDASAVTTVLDNFYVDDCLRTVKFDGQVRYVLLLAKYRLATFNTVTIPRLELMAVVLSVQIN